VTLSIIWLLSASSTKGPTNTLLSAATRKKSIRDNAGSYIYIYIYIYIMTGIFLRIFSLNESLARKGERYSLRQPLSLSDITALRAGSERERDSLLPRGEGSCFCCIVTRFDITCLAGIFQL